MKRNNHDESLDKLLAETHKDLKKAVKLSKKQRWSLIKLSLIRSVQKYIDKLKDKK